jgi:hypothetical protein
MRLFLNVLRFNSFRAWELVKLTRLANLIRDALAGRRSAASRSPAGCDPINQAFLSVQKLQKLLILLSLLSFQTYWDLGRYSAITAKMV